MNNEYQKYCKYYKGEDECPQGKDYDTFVRFWSAEMTYCLLDKKEREYYESELGQKWCTEPKELHNFIKKWDKPIRGFLAYYIITAFNMCPYEDYRFILNYGK